MRRKLLIEVYYCHCAITIQSRYPTYFLTHKLRVLNIEKSHDFMKCQANKNDLRVAFSKQIFITIGQVEELQTGS
jgi:hypothetical protein